MDGVQNASLRGRDVERLENLRPIDDDFARIVFKDQPVLVAQVLTILTGINGLAVERMETQRDLKLPAGARSAELDVWATDADGAVYDIELQTGGDPDPKRARYYGSAMDVERLRARDSFSVLPERWVVFVMERDPFGDDEALYLFEYLAPDGRRLQDGTHVLYANASWEGDGTLGDLLHDFTERNPSNMRGSVLQDRVQYLKRKEEGVSNMGKVFDEIREEGREQGMAEGRAEGMAEGVEQGARQALLENVRSLMETLSLTAQQAFDALKVPESERAGYLPLL